MESPGLGIIKMSWAGTGTIQVSVNSCLLYLFIIAIKKKNKKQSK